jgi:cell wall-associated NlpC family hydrolase
LEHWKSDTSHRFETKSRALGHEMNTVSTAGTRAAAIVDGVARAVAAAHDATQGLIDEYTRRATKILQAAQAVQGAGGQSSVLSSFATVIDLADKYTKESAQLLTAARGTAGDAATELTALTHQLREDHIVVPHARHEPAKQAKHTKQGTTASRIITAARHELGYHEHGVNIDKFGPPGQPWCSYFATAMWRKAGVQIPRYGFTGDVYTWGERHHLAYDAHHLHEVRPGDVLLFGTGPSSTTTSTHIGIVERVHGDTVTTIEGNEGNAVRQETHTLSSATFYGGVHP